MIEDKQNFIIKAQFETAKRTMSALEKFVTSLHDDYVNVEAWSVFHVWQDREFNPSVPYFSVFRAWQMFKWEPEPGTLALPLDGHCKTIAEAFLKLRKSELDSEQVSLIERSVRTCPDFFEVQTYEDESVVAMGILNKRQVRIFHPGLNSKTKSGEYIMAHSADAGDGFLILLGTSQAIPRSKKFAIQQFGRLLNGNFKQPFEFENIQSDFFNLFYDLMHSSQLRS